VTEELPAGWHVRPPTLADVPAIVAMVQASDVAAVGEPDFTTGEAQEILTAPGFDIDHDSWVVLDSSASILGWAYLGPQMGGQRENFDAYVHPELGRAAHPPLVELVLARVAQRAAAAGHSSIVLRGGAIASEVSYVELLRSSGFAFVKRYARMRRSLTDELPTLEVPSGVTLRPVRVGDDEELRSFHAVVDTAFEDTPDHRSATFEEFQERLASLPSIEWDEWFVAEVDGRIVAALRSATQAGEDEGWVKNLAVLREYRGRGIGRALLLTAFEVYRAKGRQSVGLGVDMTNPTGAYGLYESVGMHPVYEADIYERTIAADSH
jgi:mycothiol synthase